MAVTVFPSPFALNEKTAPKSFTMNVGTYTFYMSATDLVPTGKESVLIEYDASEFGSKAGTLSHLNARANSWQPLLPRFTAGSGTVTVTVPTGGLTARIQAHGNVLVTITS